MTIINSFLNNMAKASVGESFDTLTHLLVGTTEVTSIDVADTALEGEIGTRASLTRSRVNNTSSFTAIRSGTDVIDTTNGDNLRSVGADIAATGNDLQLGVVIDELQTTAFDIEFQFDVSFNRR